LKTCRTGNCTGISFTDSTALKVCLIKRERQNKVFAGIDAKGKGSLGRFFGFKLHIIINDRGEIISFVITQGNADDRQPLSLRKVLSGMSPVNCMLTEVMCLNDWQKYYL
jgi:hypothetical protein